MPKQRVAKSRSIGRTRRKHFTWLQRGMFGTRRWRFECRCGEVGPERRYLARATLDGELHSAGLNRKLRV